MVAHTGQALQPHNLWSAWNLAPLTIGPLVGVVYAYVRGARPGDNATRRAEFAGGMLALTLAIVSPLDALSHNLVSAHMVQHALLVLVGAPLLAASAPGAALLRGVPSVARARIRDARRLVGLDVARLQHLRSPIARWLLYVVTLWVWHASVVYGAAVEYEAVHLLEHAMFLGTAYLAWSAILGPRRTRVSPGVAVVAVFTLGLQGTFLSALLTFAPDPWYSEYLTPPSGWGLTPLADQQLAGALLWVSGNLVHAGIALWLFVGWLRQSGAVEVGTAPAQAGFEHRKG